MEIEIWQLSVERQYLKSYKWLRFSRAGKYRKGRGKGPGLNLEPIKIERYRAK